MKNYLGLLALCLTFISCNGGKGGPGESAPLQNPVFSEEDEKIEIDSRPKEFITVVNRKVELKPDLSNLKEFKEYLNDYTISFKAISGDFSHHEVKCYETTSYREGVVHKGRFYSNQEAQVWVHPATDNLKPAEFTCHVTGESFDKTVRVKIKKSISLGLNYNIDSLRQSSDEELDLDTLILNKSGLSIREENLYLKAATIISENGKLMTFPPHAEAMPNKEGKSGGFLKVRVGKVIGELSVELRGENGGQQSNRPPKITDIPPTPDYLHGRCVDNEENSGRKCEGKKGIKGYDGEIGYPGLPGGNTGRLELIVKNLGNSVVNVNYFPGLGSAGGEGGEGGEGGHGGEGARVRYYHEEPGRGGGPNRLEAQPKSLALVASMNAGCDVNAVRQNRGKKPGHIQYRDGDCGDKGNKGPQGDPGYDGEIEASYLQILDRDIFEEIREDWSSKGSL